MNVTMLLERMAGALGGLDVLRRCHAIRFTATVTFGTFSGRRESIFDSRGNLFLNRYDYGVFQSADGFDGETYWQVDRNGKITLTNDVGRALEMVFDLRITRHDYLVDPDSYRFELAAAGPNGELRLIVTLPEHDAEIFAHVTIGIDPATYLVRSIDRVTLGSRVVTHLSGYRRFDELSFATDITIVDADGDSDRIIIESLTVNPRFDPAIFAPGVEDPHDYQFLTGELRTTVPLLHELDHLYTEVVIAGRTYRFMIDTGASSTVIPLDLVDMLGLERLGVEMGNGVNGPQPIHHVRLPELWVGDILLMNQRIVALDFSELRKRVPDLGGILGMDFLSRFVVGLDYVKGEMEVIDRSVFEYTGPGRTVPLDFNTVEMSFDRYHGKFRIDTGGTSLSIHAPFVREHDLLRNRERLAHTSTIAGVGTTELTIHAALCRTLSIAGYTLHDMPIRLTEIATGSFSQQRIIGNVGGDVWQRFITWFDFTEGTMFIEPNVGFDDPPPHSRLGLVLKAEEGRYLVDAYLTNSPAAELGVERDDELVEFDGVPATSIPFGPLRMRFRDPAGTVIPMTFCRRDGTLLYREVVLRDFLRYYD